MAYLDDLLSNPAESRAQLLRRGFDLDVDFLVKQRADFRRLNREIGNKQARVNQISQEIARDSNRGEGHDSELLRLKGEARQLRLDIQVLKGQAAATDDKITSYMLLVPNVPDVRCPDGLDETNKREVRRWGEQPAYSFDPADHVEIGERLAIIDVERAAKLAGARFTVLRGAGAALERAIASFLLSLHINRHGYTEVSVPYLVTRAAMTGTGQLPKFEEDMFIARAADQEYFLIPTAEVPVTNLHAGEILEAANLPISYCCFTPCFRAEAGSYGRDVRGMIRQHQFLKVELVRLCEPEQAWDQLEILTSHAEEALRRLRLHYRVVKLPAGDIAFGATFCYDLEVWLPSQNAYREISSCSNYAQFQAQRMKIRYKPSPAGRTAHVATLNGSALPVGRTLLAILEQNQQADGSVLLPQVLHPIAGFSRILPNGRVE